MRNAAPVAAQPQAGKSSPAVVTGASLGPTNGVIPKAPPVIDVKKWKGETILAYLLMREITAVTTVIGDKKVHVGFAGNNAFTNGNYVNLPALPETMEVPLPIAQELRGFGVHEALHIKHTDFQLWTTGCSQAEREDPLFREMWNAIEDYWIEREGLAVYPGMHIDLSRTEERCSGGFLRDVAPQNPALLHDLRAVGPVALTWCRAVYFKLSTSVAADCLALLPQGIRDKVTDWFDLMRSCRSTGDSLAYARMFYGEAIANPSPAPKNRAGQPGNGNGNGAGTGNGAGGMTGPGGVGGTLTPQSPRPAVFGTGHNLGGALQSMGIDPTAAPSEIIINDTREFTSTSAISSDAAKAVVDGLNNPEGHVAYNTTRAEIGGAMERAGRALRRSLQAEAKVSWQSGRENGWLDSRLVAEAALGRRNVYRRRHEKKAINTALQLLIDNSGSMDGTNIETCRKIAILISEALLGTPVTFEVLGYTSSSDASDDANAKVAVLQQRGLAACANVSNIYVYKAFGQPPQKARLSIGNIDRMPSAGTPMAPALLAAFARLNARPEPRKVMFFLGDGAPDDPPRTKAVAKKIQQKCDLIGFGIRTEALKKYCRKHVYVPSIEVVPDLMMKEVTSLLLGNSLAVRSMSLMQEASA